MNRQTLPRATEFARFLLASHLRPGDTAIDATCGNGHDTLALAEWVGEGGFVLAMDLQAEAVESTRTRLAEAGLGAAVVLTVADHAGLVRKWEELAGGRPAPRAIVLNLGYLPGSGKEVITSAASTLPALAGAVELLASDGLLLCTCYPGHAGGESETSAVRAWMGALPHRTWLVASYEMPNQPARPPVVFAAQRRAVVAG